jgi:alpha-D-ribose 1-methylphosphonate 5-triphosphate synthase subunit PhnH
MTGGLTPGFADPVGDAQRCFRAVLDAMSRPGLVRQAGGLVPPPVLCAAAAAVVLSLADHETPLWLHPDLGAAADWIAFHTGAPRTGGPETASFVVAPGPVPLPSLRTGGHETPEESATLILQLAALTEGRRYRLSGPGLRQPAILAADGLPDDFGGWWRENRGLFPRGVDVILCAGTQVAALPRTATIEEV